MAAPKGNKYGKNGGRPTDYTKEKGEAICNAICGSSDSLKKICKRLKIDYVTARRWLISNEDFRNLYATSKETQADHMADEINDAANEAIDVTRNRKALDSFRLPSFVNAVKLKVDALKWTAAKLKPKKYGERLDIDQTIRQEQPLFPDVKPEKRP